jgi:DNA-binding NarL/FixJ family response regulator
MTAPIRVLIADDSFVVRSGLRNFVEALPGFEVVGEAASGREAVTGALRARPDVVLMDLRMRDGDGLAATRELAASLPDARTLIVSWSDEPEHVRDAVSAGARGYLVHGQFGARELETALRAVAAGDANRSPILVGRIATPDRREAAPDEAARLTTREIEILALVRRGRRNREIAAELGVEEKTIKNHLNSIYSKLDLGSRIEAMAPPPRDAPGTPER